MDLWDAGALGMVETRGLTASIVAVDVMAKAAEVKVIGVRRIGAGLVTVSFIGDMASVTAAIEGARRAVAAVGGTLVSTVIGRPAIPTGLLRDTDPTGAQQADDRQADDGQVDAEQADGRQADGGQADGPEPGGERAGGDEAGEPAGKAVTGAGQKRRSARPAAPRRRPPASGPPEPPSAPPTDRPRGK
ncbi:BMC domain-containing protein [Micromonospora sp. DT62]|uniref:BMC domain-containing protein n=1 Tax=Micromonospora sp. DT62 TaxID=3416521 RepID=UPI003CF56513